VYGQLEVWALSEPVFVAVAVLVVAGLVQVYFYLFEFGGLGRLGV